MLSEGMVWFVSVVAARLCTIRCFVNLSLTTANCDLCFLVVILSVSLHVRLDLLLSSCLTFVCVWLFRLRLSVVFASVCPVCLSRLRLSVRPSHVTSAHAQGYEGGNGWSTIVHGKSHANAVTVDRTKRKYQRQWRSVYNYSMALYDDVVIFEGVRSTRKGSN